MMGSFVLPYPVAQRVHQVDSVPALQLLVLAGQFSVFGQRNDMKLNSSKRLPFSDMAAVGEHTCAGPVRISVCENIWRKTLAQATMVTLKPLKDHMGVMCANKLTV